MPLERCAGLMPIGPPMWQAEADLTHSALPAAALGQLRLTLVNWRYSTVLVLCSTTGKQM